MKNICQKGVDIERLEDIAEAKIISRITPTWY